MSQISLFSFWISQQHSSSAKSAFFILDQPSIQLISQVSFLHLTSAINTVHQPNQLFTSAIGTVHQPISFLHQPSIQFISQLAFYISHQHSSSAKSAFTSVIN